MLLIFYQAQFWSSRFFAQYNMLVNHFYSSLGNKHFQTFLGATKKLLIVVDPPFGALCELVGKSLKSLYSEFRNSKQVENDETKRECYSFWISPYFLESKIVQTYDMKMTDYQVCTVLYPCYVDSFVSLRFFFVLSQVEYENHPLYKRIDKKRGSPIRIFTDFPMKDIVMPCEKYR